MNWDEARKMSLDGLIRETVNGDTTIPTSAVADHVLDHLWSLWEDGVEWAEIEIRRRCREGIRRRVWKYIKANRGVVRIGHTGQIVDMPTHVGIETSIEGGQTVYQLRLWWELSWPEFLELIAVRTRQRRILSRELKAFNEIAKLWEQYPDSRTPEEACMFAQIDPKQFDLGDDQTG